MAKVYRPTWTRNGKRQRSRTWYLDYSVRKKRVRESSGTTVKADAEALLARKVAALRPGGPLPSELRTVSFSDLAELLREDHRRKGNRSPVRLNHLEPYFNGWRAVDIDTAAVQGYIRTREKEGAKGGTINRELAALRRAMRLGQRVRMVDHLPTFEMLPENVREGFITEDQFGSLLTELPDYLRPLVEFLYVTGWRVGDALSRTWKDVDLGDPGWVRIEGSDTKEKRGRQFPMIPRLRSVLEAQQDKREDFEAKLGRKIPHVFFYYRTQGAARAGAPLGDCRHAWRSACERAEGVPEGLYIHDLRRSAARSFIRAGMSERNAMALTGHQTPSILRRYDIVSESDLLESGEKLSAFFDAGAKHGKR